MSAYMTLPTPMTDQECLLAALADLGFHGAMVEVHSNPVRLVGFRGDRRTQAAEIVIRRQHLSSSSNDLGFAYAATGYQALISGYDHPRFGLGWLGELRERYQQHTQAKQARLAEAERRRQQEERRRLVESQVALIQTQAKKMGYRLAAPKREGEKVRLVLTRNRY